MCVCNRARQGWREHACVLDCDFEVVWGWVREIFVLAGAIKIAITAWKKNPSLPVGQTPSVLGSARNRCWGKCVHACVCGGVWR